MSDDPLSTDLANQYAAQLFGQPKGEALLAYFRRLTIDRQTQPEISDAELRSLEGARNFVRLIETMIRNGRTGPAKSGD